MKTPYYFKTGPRANGSIWVGKRPLAATKDFTVYMAKQLRKRIAFLLLWTATFSVSGFLYSKIIHPEFVATTQILLKPHVILNDGPENLRHFYQFVIDSAQCETELYVITSRDMLFQVFKNQKLATVDGDQESADGFWAFLDFHISRLQNRSTPYLEAVTAFNAFRGRVRARRLGLSYVIEISYRGRSAEQATRIVNAIASTYAAYKLRGVFAHEQRRGAYLASRLTSVSDQIAAADAGSNFGVIPEDGLPDADVRLLGPASQPLGAAYPKTGLLVLLMGGLGLTSGLLIILIQRDVSTRQFAPVDAHSPFKR